LNSALFAVHCYNLMTIGTISRQSRQFIDICQGIVQTKLTRLLVGFMHDRHWKLASRISVLPKGPFLSFFKVVWAPFPNGCSTLLQLDRWLIGVQ
jgi:hypothetical protein